MILFSNDALNWSKVSVKTFRLFFQIKVLFNFLFCKERWKNVWQFAQKYWTSKKVLLTNINNQAQIISFNCCKSTY